MLPLIEETAIHGLQGVPESEEGAMVVPSDTVEVMEGDHLGEVTFHIPEASLSTSHQEVCYIITIALCMGVLHYCETTVFFVKNFCFTGHLSIG